MALSTNFKDDILNESVNEKRKYQMTYNDDGTVSFTDVTSYSQTGSEYGAAEVNEERQAINELNSALTAMLNTTYGARIRKIGNTKMIFISNSKGINTSDALDFSFDESFPELFPTMSLSKWVILRDNVTAYLEITADGHVKLSHISANIPKGTWINICEVYF